MVKNYFKIGYRNILRQKTSSFINIFGLSCAIACSLVAYLFISSAWLKGVNYENRDEIYLLTHTAQSNSHVQRYGFTSAPIAEILKEESSNLKNVAVVNATSGVVKLRGDSFYERVQYVNPEYLDMFTYGIKYGSPEALKEPNQVIITENLAEKLFFMDHPVGNDIEIIINGKPQLFSIGAVLGELPATELFNFDILVNNQNLKKVTDALNLEVQWDQGAWIFVQTTQPDRLEAGFNEIVKTQNTIDPDRKYLGIQLESLTTLMENAMEIEGGVGSYNIAPQILLGAIAIILLALAIFNYINIALLMASHRIKEIGVRKTIGGRRSQLIFQFLTENLILCFLAIVLGGLIAHTLMLPWFNGVAGSNLQLDLLNNGHLVFFLVVLLLIITVISGAYPAFYISSFKTTNIFRGNYKLKSKSGLTSTLLIMQFVLSIITIVAGISFVQTNNSNEHRDWGFNNENKLIVNIPTSQDYEILRDKLAQHSNVKSIGGSQYMFGERQEETVYHHNNEEYELNLVNASANYGDLIGLRVKQGRLLDPKLASDSSAIVVNQTFLDWMGASFPLENKVMIDSAYYDIVGVVEDFHYNHFAFTVIPTAVKIAPQSNLGYMTIEVAPGTMKEMKSEIKKEWMAQIDNEYYLGLPLNEVFDRYFNEMKDISYILIFTSILSIILASMGLFGLVSMNIEARLKDFGIRKIMGATTFELSKLISRRFIILWTLAAVFGGSLAYFAISGFLDLVYAYHPGLGIMPLVIALVVLFLVLLITVSGQIIRVEKSNPVNILKAE